MGAIVIDDDSSGRQCGALHHTSERFPSELLGKGGGEGWEGGDKGEGGSIGRGPPWRRGVSTLTYDERQEVSLNSSGDEDRPMWAEAFFSPLPRAPLQL